MIQKYALICLAFFAFIASGFGQTLYDSFSDGNFNATPTWTGNTTLWQIVANSDVAAGATGSNTLRLNSTGGSTDYLSSQIATWGTEQEWGFFMGRRGQAFTSANQQYFWLYANEATLNNATVDGYRIAIGDDAGGDDIRLEYIVNGAVSATVIASAGAINNGLTDIGLLIRVTRSSTGLWTVYTSAIPTANGNGAIATAIPNATNAPTQRGQATNNSLVPAANGYIGVAALHSTGAAAIIAAEFDQIYFTVIGTPTTYSVTYAGNGSDGGTAPTDATVYDSGDTVTVLNTGNLTRDGYYFTGWNTATNGSGTPYLPGATFSIIADTTLYAQWTEIPYDYCLDVDFDDDFGNLPGGFVSTGAANTDPDFYISAGYSRSLAATQTLRTPAMVRPAAIEFYAIGSGAGGQLLTLEYTNDGTNWFPLTTYNVSAEGATFYYDSSATTSAEPVAAYRITSGSNTIYIDDLTVYCTCDLTASGIADITCNNNGTNATTADDFITFELDPTVLSSSTTYNVSVSSGTITPNMNINYGSPTTFTLQGGSAGAGNVTVTITDGISGGCELDVVITDPESCSVSTVDWCNIQFPNTTQTITEGDNFDVYAQVYEPGVTEAAGAGVGITAWIGYNTVNNSPDNVGWIWVPANFNAQVGNNDEFDAEIGSGLDPGTYYYASRFQLNGSTFIYGGTGGIWNNDSVQLNVVADQLDFCNVDFPKTATIDEGDNHNVYAQAYEPGITENPGQDALIEAWIGYTTVGIDYQPWQATGWTWVPATYESAPGNNYQYVADIGSGLGVGTYYYASRFRLNGSSTYSYGGIQNDNVGNFWNAGTFNNGVLVVEVASCADLFISEYIEGSSNNKYIEIYNPTNAAINLTGYQLRLYANGAAAATSTENLTGSIPAYGTIVYSNSSAAIYGGATVNTAVCNFNGDDAIALFNGGNLIDVIGRIGQDPGTAWTAPGYSTLDRTLVRRAIVQSGVIVNPATGFPTLDTEWDVYGIDTTTYLGSHTSDCQGPTPELQLVDADGDDQNCGYTIDFGSQALTTTTDITFDIENTGTANLDITSLALSGTNAGDYTIVSPVGAFTVAPAGSQEVVVRFTPSANGTRTATLTINNNDANEGACTVLLTGVGFTPAPEINVEGNVGAFPDIVGDATNIPNGTNNTLYAAQFIGSSQTKSFWVNNEGTSDLTITNISLGGANPGDFTIDVLPNFTIAPGSIRTQLLEITFSPLAAGERNATVIIENNDGDEANFVFNIRGNGNCVSTATSIAPSTGPVGTIVTVTGTDFGGSTTATVSGIAATVTVISATQIEVTIPAGASSGNIAVLNDVGCSSINSFTIIESVISTCEGSGTLPSDLFISEVTDATYGGLTYVELFNGTGASVNLSDYAIQLFRNGVTTPQYTLGLNNVALANNSTYVLGIGYIAAFHCSNAGGNGSLANQLSTLEGINKTDNQHDMLRLVKSGGTVVVDAFGEYGSTNWMDATAITGDRGFNFRRLNTASALPSPTIFNLADWNIIDWVGSGESTCNTNDYSDIGAYDYSVGVPPIVNTLNAPTSDCNLSATLTVTGTEGFNGGGDTQELAYQWYYSAPGELGWTEVPDNAVYDGVTTDTLEILNTLTLDGYQYYCQIREDDATCYTASNAIKLSVDATVWTAGAWSDGLPNINRIAIIDANYNTSAGGQQISFSACNLLVRTGRLTIADNTYVEVENNVTVESEIYVNERGSFKQNNNDGDVSVSGTVLVRKETAPMNNWYEYTYWSSPVAGETVGNALNDATPSRRFWFNAQNFLDETAETGNNNATVDGQDDIDDNANDWTLTAAGDVMIPGRGYASTHRSNIFSSTPGPLPHQFVYTFNGPFNNGIYNVPVYRNDLETQDINWNFIGNPYPSAIGANAFLTANTLLDTNLPTPGFIDGAIYLWSQNTAPADDANGNEALNFAQADYAIINGTAQSAGGDGVMPTRYIPSGQGFFVSLSDAAATTVVSGTIRTANVVFNNQMRVTGNNNQFFRIAEDAQPNKLWVNLTSDNGVFNQIVVGYVDGATDAYDGMYYDAPRNLSTDANSILYTIIPDSDKKLAIQGKEPNSLTLDEVIPLGFYTSINQATIYKLSIAQFEGEFFNNQTVFVKDNLLNLYHDLSAADYPFTSETGEFNERFEIVFQTQTLGVGDVDLHPNDVSLIELNNGHVKFTVGHNLTIASVEIYDMLGRQLYNLLGTNAIEVYNLANLSQAAYVAKVTLSNGQTVTKRAVKRK